MKQRDWDNPFAGPRPYVKGDGLQFAPRSDLEKRLLKAIRGTKSALVFGPSGSGKSSLLHCALPGAMEEEGLKLLVYSEWSPKLDLETTKNSVLEQLKKVATGATESALRNTLCIDSGVGAFASVMLVFDQLDHLYSSAFAEDLREGILSWIIDIAQCERGEFPGSVSVAFSIRDDYLGPLLGFMSKEDYQPDRLFQIPRLKLRDLLDTAHKVVPSWVGDKTLEAQLCETSLPKGVSAATSAEDSDNNPELNAPLAQIVLLERYRSELIQRKRLSFDAILRSYLRSTVAKISASEGEIVAFLFNCFGGETRKRISSFDEIVATVRGRFDKSGIAEILDALRESRLITEISTGAGHELAYTLSHDALCEVINTEAQLLQRSEVAAAAADKERERAATHAQTTNRAIEILRDESNASREQLERQSDQRVAELEAGFQRERSGLLQQQKEAVERLEGERRRDRESLLQQQKEAVERVEGERRRDRESLLREQREAVERVEAKGEAAQSGLRLRHEQELKQLRASHEQQLRQLRQQHVEDVAQVTASLGERFGLLSSEMEKKTREHEAELQSLRTKHKDELTEKTREHKAELQSRLEQQAVEHAAELQLRHGEYLDECERKAREHKEEQDAKAREHEGELKGLSEKYEGELQGLSKKHEGELKGLSKKHEGERQELELGHRDALQEQGEAYSAALKDRQQRHQGRLAQVEARWVKSEAKASLWWKGGMGLGALALTASTAGVFSYRAGLGLERRTQQLQGELVAEQKQCAEKDASCQRLSRAERLLAGAQWLLRTGCRAGEAAECGNPNRAASLLLEIPAAQRAGLPLWDHAAKQVVGSGRLRVVPPESLSGQIEAIERLSYADDGTVSACAKGSSETPWCFKLQDEGTAPGSWLRYKPSDAGEAESAGLWQSRVRGNIDVPPAKVLAEFERVRQLDAQRHNCLGGQLRKAPEQPFAVVPIGSLMDPRVLLLTRRGILLRDASCNGWVPNTSDCSNWSQYDDQLARTWYHHAAVDDFGRYGVAATDSRLRGFVLPAPYGCKVDSSAKAIEISRQDGLIDARFRPNKGIKEAQAGRLAVAHKKEGITLWDLAAAMNPSPAALERFASDCLEAKSRETLLKERESDAKAAYDVCSQRLGRSR